MSQAAVRLGLETLEARDVPSGNGLTGRYFDNANFTGPSLTRIDPVIRFNWGTGSFDSEFGANSFSARWTGQIEAGHSQRYTFTTLSDDGVRLWVNGRLIINNWTRHTATANTGTITLVGGRRYDIRLDYFEHTAAATVRLLWSCPGLPREVVPQDNLYSVRRPAAPTGLTAAPLSTSSIRLAWSDAADNESGFLVERSMDGAAFTTVAMLGANTTNFDDSGLADATTYYYRVRAFNAAGSGGASNIAAATTADQPTIIYVSNTTEFRAAVNAAAPNTHILLQPGVYGAGNYFADIHGEPGGVIVIGAADPANQPIFRGGSETLHFSDCSYLELRDLIVEQAAANGINIDDGGSFETPAHHITLRNLIVRDIGATGNQDGIKLSGLDNFLIVGCDVQRWGAAGSAIDMVGCHSGVIRNSSFRHGDTTGSHGVQAKGGSRDIVIRENRFEHAGARAVQIGGSTGLQYFRPQPPPGYEAQNVTVERNIFVGSQAAVAFTNTDGATVRFNTIYRPTRWVFRILQETTEAGFVPSRNGVVTDNIIAFRSDELSTAVNVGPNTAPETFTFARNWWFCINNPAASTPALPVSESNGVYGIDPLFLAPATGDFHLQSGSPAEPYGAYAP